MASHTRTTEAGELHPSPQEDLPRFEKCVVAANDTAAAGSFQNHADVLPPSRTVLRMCEPDCLQAKDMAPTDIHCGTQDLGGRHCGAIHWGGRTHPVQWSLAAWRSGQMASIWKRIGGQAVCANRRGLVRADQAARQLPAYCTGASLAPTMGEVFQRSLD